ncbi:type I-E CRISPR-associated protein Cse1/CasA [Actinomadura geliboluensis]|uniref:type I-E CRISPR-associated protein Cse1/CasA n=1 Tax=Actinomadura geliboluensis TaxID=882440 RepID=UPI003715522C
MTGQGFNLVHQPWIPVQTLSGELVELGIAETLTRAHELAGICAETQMEEVVLHRLLLAIVHRALDGPANHQQWAHWWQEGRLYTAQIIDYLDEHTAGFDLWDHERPFAQTPGLQCKRVPVDRLTAHPDRGAGAGWFTPVPTELTPARAAVWLLWCHAFDTGGIRARHGGGREMGVPAGHAGWAGQIQVCGRSLAHTLLLSLVPYPASADEGRRSRRADDAGWWERRDPPGRRRDQTPLGLVHALTWPGRRILLHRDDDGMVRTVQISAGDDAKRLPGDPHTLTPWRRTAQLSLVDPLRLAECAGSADGSDDQDAAAPEAGSDRTAPAPFTADQQQPVPPQPGVLAALGERVAAGHIDPATRVRIVVTGVQFDQYRSMIENTGSWQLATHAAAWTTGAPANRKLCWIAQTLHEVEQAVVSAVEAAERTKGARSPEQIRARGDDARMQLRHELSPALTYAAAEPTDEQALQRLLNDLRTAAARHLSAATDLAIQGGRST